LTGDDEGVPLCIRKEWTYSALVAVKEYFKPEALRLRASHAPVVKSWLSTDKG
jgi:hypothetical protein